MPPTLTGRWTGSVQTYAGSTPVELQVKENGDVLARVGNRPLSIVDEVDLNKDGLLQLSNIASVEVMHREHDGDDCTSRLVTANFQSSLMGQGNVPDQCETDARAIRFR